MRYVKGIATESYGDCPQLPLGVPALSQACRTATSDAGASPDGGIGRAGSCIRAIARSMIFLDGSTADDVMTSAYVSSLGSPDALLLWQAVQVFENTWLTSQGSPLFALSPSLLLMSSTSR